MNGIQAKTKAMHVYNAYKFAEISNFVWAGLHSIIVISKIIAT